jgi:Laminin G domain.
MVGQVFSFDGVDDFIQVPHNSNLDPGTGSFTVDAWIKTTNTTGTQFVVSKYECGQLCIFNVSNSLYSLSVKDGQLAAQLRDTDKGGPPAENEGQILIGTTSVADGVFHHIAMVRDLAAGELRLYVDGVLDASASLNAGATGAIKDDDGEANPFLIGAFIKGGTSTRTSFFSGVIDEVEFNNRALSAALLGIYNAGSAGKCKASTVLDHFKCYKAEGNPLNMAVDLQDQFGVESGVLVQEPQLFCNPVDKNGEGIRNPAAHLTCYKIKADREKRDVVATNQFGEQSLEVKKPELLCVPSGKFVP